MMVPFILANHSSAVNMMTLKDHRRRVKYMMQKWGLYSVKHRYSLPAKHCCWGATKLVLFFNFQGRFSN